MLLLGTHKEYWNVRVGKLSGMGITIEFKLPTLVSRNPWKHSFLVNDNKMSVVKHEAWELSNLYILSYLISALDHKQNFQLNKKNQCLCLLLLKQQYFYLKGCFISLRSSPFVNTNNYFITLRSNDVLLIIKQSVKCRFCKSKISFLCIYTFLPCQTYVVRSLRVYFSTFRL